MARGLDPTLNRLMLDSDVRRPGFRVEIFDFRSTSDTINSVVRGDGLLPLTGPRDFTGDVVSVDVRDVAGDFLTEGVAASELTLVVLDPNDVFNPLDVLLDATGDGRWLRAGNGIRIREGDEAVDDSLWPITFTGTLVGAAGVSRSRVDQTAFLTVKAVDRTADFLGVNLTSVAFGQGSTYLSMATDIATIEMGLDSSELDFAGFGSRITGHRVTQFLDESPLVMLAQIMMVDGFMPRFDGEGKLTQTLGNVTGFPDRVYQDFDLFRKIDQPFSDVDVVNSVCVLGLAAELTKIKQPRQTLAETHITTGYFAQDEKFDVYWSKDRTTIAEDVDVDVKRSVNGAIHFGGGEEFDFIDAPGGSPGFIGVEVSVSTGFAPYLIIMLTVGYLAVAWIPDEVVSIIAGVTIPVGRVVQAAVLINLLLVMMAIGRLHAEFEGSPIEFVFKEIRACARRSGTLVADRNEVTVENQLIQDQATADTVARELLFRAIARGNPRRVEQLYDVALEVDDIFELPDPKYGPRRFLIHAIERRLQRGTVPLATFTCSEITSGVTP